MARQAVASAAFCDRTALPAILRILPRVIYGLADRMCDVSGGRATASVLPSTERRLIAGHGHDLPPALRPERARRITAYVIRAMAARAKASGTPFADYAPEPQRAALTTQSTNARSAGLSPATDSLRQMGSVAGFIHGAGQTVLRRYGLVRKV